MNGLHLVLRHERQKVNRIVMTSEKNGELSSREAAAQKFRFRFLQLSSGGFLNLQPDYNTAKKNIFQRLKELEDRIMYLESVSPDLFIQPGPRMPPPREYINDEENLYEKYANWSIEEVENRIQYLTEKLRAKAAAKKHPPC
ncbi:hypothetical protein TNCV_3221611 [Trichonephila clavipes]|nr:hypothetical protein TNCV_3221611 [Trichonephila clavipes]